MNLQDYKIKNSTTCDCGYEFTIHNLTELKRVDDDKFYGGNIKHVSETHCPLCLRKTLLLLKQVGQTYKVIDIAQKDRKIIEAKTIEIDENEKEIKDSNTEQRINEQTIDNYNLEKTQIGLNELFICPNCKRTFKSKSGLTIHTKTCGK